MAGFLSKFVGLNISAAKETDDFTNLLIVGKTGEGKSSTANTIIGEKRFHASAQSGSKTKKCQREVARVQGKPVLVVDSPGLADTDIRTDEGLEQLQSEVTNVLATQPDGFDAFLIVTKFGKRVTAEDCEVLGQLDAFFGKDFVRDFGILLVSGADNYDPEENDNLPIETVLINDTGPMQIMRKKCNRRMICFDNRTKDAKIRQDQVKRLLDMVAEMKQNAERYTPDAFKRAQRERDEVILKSKEPIIRDKTEKSLRLITEDLEKVPRNMTSFEYLEGLKANLGKHREELINQDKGTHILEGLIARVESIIDSINGVIEIIKYLHENEERSRLEEERRIKWEQEEKARRKDVEKRAKEERVEREEQERKKLQELERERREEKERLEKEKKKLETEKEKLEKEYQQREERLQGDVKDLRSQLDNSFWNSVANVATGLMSAVSGWWPSVKSALNL